MDNTNWESREWPTSISQHFLQHFIKGRNAEVKPLSVIIFTYNIDIRYTNRFKKTVCSLASSKVAAQ